VSSKPESSAAAQASQANLANQMAATGATETAEGTKLFNMALPGLEQSESYYGKLASGDPNALARANAPAIQAITQSTDKAKQNIMQSSPRGGERNLALEEADLSKGAQVGQLETGSYTSSFGSLAGLGGQNVGQGTAAQSSGTQGMNAAANQYQNIQNTNAAAKSQQIGLWSDVAGTGMEAASMCWIAASLWSGWNDRRTRLVQFWLRNVYSKTIFGNLFCRLYSRYGERVAEQVRKRSVARSVAEPLFGWFLLKAQEV
jgi:hypothetical protein